MKSQLIFNLNQVVKVRLTPAAKLSYPVPPQEDEEGYSRHQLWSLFQRFGPSIGLGCNLPFEGGQILISISPDNT